MSKRKDFLMASPLLAEREDHAEHDAASAPHLMQVPPRTSKRPLLPEQPAMQMMHETSAAAEPVAQVSTESATKMWA
jgi:hypothetical protein